MSANRGNGGDDSRGRAGGNVGGGGPDYRKAYYAQQHGYEAAEAKFGPDSNTNNNINTFDSSNTSGGRGGGGRAGGRGGRGRAGGGYSAHNDVFQGGANHNPNFQPPRQPPRGGGGGRGGAGGNHGNNSTCFKCGQAGHFSRECPNAQPAQSQFRGAGQFDNNAASRGAPAFGGYGGRGAGQSVGGNGGTCFQCGQQGHMARDCPRNQQQRGGGGGGNNGFGSIASNTNNVNSSSANGSRSNNNAMNNTNSNRGGGGGGACFRCGQQGHLSRDCPQQQAGRGRGRQDFQEGGEVNSDTRTNYDRIIRQFIENEELTEMTFPSTLNPGERHAVHELAMHYNLDHASSGPKTARMLKLTKKGGLVKGGTGVSTDGQQIAESSKLTSDGIVKTMDGYQGLQDLGEERLDTVGADVAKLIAAPHAKMMTQLQKIVTEGAGALTKARRFAEESGFSGARPKASNEDRAGKEALQKFRKSLPSYKVKDSIVECVKNNEVTIIAGDTGCGKTTQIPQILYDAHIFPEERAIICTQPRRISALSVAQRVAKERGEACGDSCGYIIRFENATSSATRIVYLTTGILLRRMNSDPTLKGVSCVVLDEVHERDLFTDFALLMLRDLLVSGKAPHLRVVVMSATIQIDKLQKYFTLPKKGGGLGPVPPIVSIPGTLFKVAEYFLEDALRWLKMPNEAASAMNLIELQKDVKADAATEDAGTASAAAASPSSPTTADPSEYEKMKAAALTQLGKDDEMTVPFDVVVNLIEMFHSQSRDSGEAILIFLPGWQQISRVGDMLRRSKYSRELSVFMLHSSISATQQARVFYPPPRGFRKVVLATNIAETSITIDDVVFVIDSCILKGTAYDSAGNTVSLKSQMIAKANGIQRRGRAGRVRAGVCVHLLPKSVYAELPDYLPPEILRASLDEVCLQIKALNETDSVVDVLARAMDTPSFASIAHAVKMLKEMSAFDHREKLTNLGRALAAMPLHPQLGKMLLVAAVLGVLAPVAIISSALSAKSPFVRPMPFEMDAFNRVKDAFDGDDASDHLAALRLYNGWIASGCSPAYARSNFADDVVLRGMRRSAQQLMRLVYQCGFLRHVLPESLRGAASNRSRGDDSAMELALRYASRHQDNNGLIRMALLWSFYPRIGCSENHKTRGKRELFCWDNKPCAAHSSSILFKKKKDFYTGREFFMYFERMRIEVNLNVMDATLVTPLMAILCAQIVTMHALKDVPEKCFDDEESKFGPLRNSNSQTYSGKVKDVKDMPILTTTVLQMDKGKKLFCCPNSQAVVIRDLREVMEFYFSLAVKSVDAALFPQEVVQAIGEAIGFSVAAVDLNAIKSGTNMPAATGSGGPGAGENDDDEDSAPQTQQFSWNNRDSGDEASEGEEAEKPVIVDEDYVERITNTIFDTMTEEQKNKIYDAYGDLTVLRRRDKDFKIVAIEGDEAVHSTGELLSPESEALSATPLPSDLQKQNNLNDVELAVGPSPTSLSPTPPPAATEPTRFSQIVSEENTQYEDVAWN